MSGPKIISAAMLSEMNRFLDNEKQTGQTAGSSDMLFIADGTWLKDAAEGDDKPKKYPGMFLTSELMLVSKADLLPYVPFSVQAVTKDARDINPDLEVITISSIKGDGLEQWCDWLMQKVKQKKANLILS